MAIDKTPRVCWSAGHGLGSRVAGRIDPGANIVGDRVDEWAVVRQLAINLNADCEVLFAKLPGSLTMVRDAGPYFRADDDAARHLCDTFVELHVDSSTNKRANGTSVYFEDPRDKPLAVELSARVSEALTTRNRGAQSRDDLAVLNPHPGMEQVLVELFMGSNAGDVAKWREHHIAAELAILNTYLRKIGARQVKSVPRGWSRAQKMAYRPF